MNDQEALSKTRNPLKLLGAYDEEHRNPVNRAFHAVGIPVIVLSVIFLILPWRPFGWSRLVMLGTFIGGWGLLWSGHLIFEGNMPATFKAPAVILTAPAWWVQRLLRMVGFRSGQ